MADVTINKVRSGENYVPGTFFCEDCGEPVKRKSNFHLRCKKCAAERIVNFRVKRQKEMFPVLRKDIQWMPGYFDLTKNAEDDSSRELKGERICLNFPSPCEPNQKEKCPLFNHCVENSLACKSFYLWSSDPNPGRRGKWGKREKPNRLYYASIFPNDPICRKDERLGKITWAIKCILSANCNGSGMTLKGIFDESQRLKLSLSMAQIKNNTQSLFYRGKIRRVGDDVYFPLSKN